MKRNLLSLWALALAIIGASQLLTSCKKYGHDPVTPQYGKVFIMYCAGYNNLASNIRLDQQDLFASLPVDTLSYRVLFCSQLAKSDYNWQTPVSPVVVDAYCEPHGTVILDTLLTLDSSRNLSQADAMEEMLTFINKRFPAKEYGLVFSSHGTGWLPEGYYAKPESVGEGTLWMSGKRDGARLTPQTAPSGTGRHIRSLDEDFTKSATVTYSGIYPSKYTGTEMEIEDLAAALPMHFKYIAMDMCLMGGIETAYQLRDKTDLLAFSQTEILADGFQYTVILDHLLYNTEPDLVAVCDDYYQFYAKQGSSASISLIDCTQLEPLAAVSAAIVESNYVGIMTEREDSLQRYFRNNRHYFYDLRDIFARSGASDEEVALLDASLSSCVKYKACTPKCFGITMKCHSGLSMFFPPQGTDSLRNFYSDFDWNRVTSLVKSK